MKKLLLLLLLLSNSLYLYAQTPQINETFAQQQEAIFGKLNMGNVPTGILADYSFPFTELSAFDGTLRDSVYTDGGLVKDIYKTIYSGAVAAKSSVNITPDVYGQKWFTRRNENEVVLSGVLFKYNTFKPDALRQGLIRQDSQGTLYDVYTNGVWQNPYTENHTFAIAPGIQQFYGKNLNVVLPADLLLGNETANIAKIEVDFNDGKRFQPLVPGRAISVSYATDGTKEWQYKVTLSGGKILFNRSRILIIDWQNPVIIGTIPVCGTLNGLKKITATKAFQGEYGKLKLTLRCSGDGIINNPLIVAEGFDIGNILEPENPNGTTSIVTFNNTVGASPFLNDILVDNRQYDIIYVDWENGMDYMERNAYALQEAIKWVNSVKQGNSPNVIIGQSMGGVVARYALTDMENNGQAHDTNLFISHDAPQQGAVVPDAYQHMYRHLTNQYIRIRRNWLGNSVLVRLIDTDTEHSINGIAGLLDQPAAKQLLKEWVSADNTYNNSAHTDFYTQLRGMNDNNGYPKLTRNIALSNGSECGSPQLGVTPGGNLMDFNFDNKPTFFGGLWRSIISPMVGIFGGIALENTNFVKAGFVGAVSTDHRYTLTLNAKAVQGTGLAQEVYHTNFKYRYKLFGVFQQQITLFNVSHNGRSYGAYESYGGGFFQLYDETNQNERQKFESTDKYSLSVAPRFDFIPTVSALDIGKYQQYLPYAKYSESYVGANPPTGQYASPFANFSTEYNPNSDARHNYYHITFNPRNGRWLATELNQARNNTANYSHTDCSWFCADAGITGADYICGSNTYTYSIPEFSNTTITWAVSGLTIVSGQGTSNLVVKASGTASTKQVMVTLRTENCGTKTYTKAMRYGQPFMQGTIDGPQTLYVNPQLPYNFPITYTAPTATGASYYEWILPGSYEVVQQFSANNAPYPNWQLLAATANTNQVKVKSNQQTNGQIKVRACNDCGCSDYVTLQVNHVVQHLPGDFVITPNPADLTIQIYSQSGNPPVFRDGMTDVVIYDMNGRSRKTFKMKSEGTTVNVSDLEAGMYKVVIDLQNDTYQNISLVIVRK